MKKCTKCGKEKPIENFSDMSQVYTNKHGIAKRYFRKLSWCRSCVAELSKKKYHKRKIEINARRRERYIEKKRLVYEHYGKKCACCGEDEPLFLDVDHINNDGHKFRDKKGRRAIRNIYQWLVQKNFPQGFQILCANCNQAKRRNNGVCPHLSRRFDGHSEKK